MLTLEPFRHPCLLSCSMGIVLPFGENTTDENTEPNRSTLLDRDIAFANQSSAVLRVTDLGSATSLI